MPQIKRATPISLPANDDLRLTARELEVLRLMAHDRQNKEMAKALELSVKTIEFHKARIYQRLGVAGPVGAVRWAIRRGYLTA